MKKITAIALFAAFLCCFGPGPATAADVNLGSTTCAQLFQEIARNKNKSSQLGPTVALLLGYANGVKKNKIIRRDSLEPLLEYCKRNPGASLYKALQAR